MSILRNEFFHGCVLVKVISKVNSNLRMIESNDENGIYIIDDKDVFYIKYCASPSQNGKIWDWRFTFKPSHLIKLAELNDHWNGSVYLSLVCGQKNLNEKTTQICFIDIKEASKCLDIQIQQNQQIIVKYMKNKELRVKGSKRDQDFKVPANALDTWIASGNK